MVVSIKRWTRASVDVRSPTNTCWTKASPTKKQCCSDESHSNKVCTQRSATIQCPLTQITKTLIPNPMFALNANAAMPIKCFLVIPKSVILDYPESRHKPVPVDQDWLQSNTPCGRLIYLSRSAQPRPAVLVGAQMHVNRHVNRTDARGYTPLRFLQYFPMYMSGYKPYVHSQCDFCTISHVNQ